MTWVDRWATAGVVHPPVLSRSCDLDDSVAENSTTWGRFVPRGGTHPPAGPTDTPKRSRRLLSNSVRKEEKEV